MLHYVNQLVTNFGCKLVLSKADGSGESEPKQQSTGRKTKTMSWKML